MSIFEDIGPWYSVKENLPPNFKLGSCWNNFRKESQLHDFLKDFLYVYWELWTNWNVCILILKTTTWIFRSLLSVLRIVCKVKCLCTDHRISIMKEFLEAHEKKKKSQAWQFDGSAPPAWGMGRGARRDCPGCSPTVVGGTLRPFPNGHSCMQSCLLLFPSSPSFSQWFGWNNVFYSNDPRFHLILPLQELSASHLAALESPNDWLGKQTVGKTPPGCLKGMAAPPGRWKGVQSASCWTKGMYIVPPNSTDRWRGKRSQEVRPQGDLLYHCACVLVFGSLGFFVFVFAQCWQKDSSPLLHGSCLIQSWIISSCWNHSSRMDRTISWWLV